MKAIYTGLALGLFYLLLSAPGLRAAASRCYICWGALALVAYVGVALARLPRVFPWIPLVAGGDYWPNQLLVVLVGLTGIGLLIMFAGWQREEFGLRLSYNPTAA